MMDFVLLQMHAWQSRLAYRAHADTSPILRKRVVVTTGKIILIQSKKNSINKELVVIVHDERVYFQYIEY
jgi:hypothetical protein